MAVFPQINYHPLKDGFSIDTDNPLLRTQMNSGTYRQRNKYTTPISTMKASYRWTANELAQFLAFRQSLGGGAARFQMPVWNYQTFVLKWVQIDLGSVMISDFVPGPPVYCIAAMTLRIEGLFQ